MLTKLEMNLILRIYRISCKSFTMPSSWRNVDVPKTTKNSCRLIWNWFVWFLTVVTVSIRISRIPPAIRRGDADAAILTGISVLEIFYYVLTKSNIWIHQDEFRELIEQVMTMNSIWGEQI